MAKVPMGTSVRRKKVSTELNGDEPGAGMKRCGLRRRESNGGLTSTPSLADVAVAFADRDFDGQNIASLGKGAGPCWVVCATRVVCEVEIENEGCGAVARGGSEVGSLDRVDQVAAAAVC